MDTILEEHIPLVQSIVNHFYVPFGLDRDDLVQAGLIGVWKATQFYQNGRGAEFVTYAYVSARNEIMQLLRKHKKYEQEGPLLVEALVEPTRTEDLVLQQLIAEDLAADEQQLVQLLYEGYTQREIARKLDTSQPRICQRMRQLRVKGKRNWGTVD